MSQAINEQASIRKASSIENQFTSSAVSQAQIDVLNQLLKPEVQESLTVLVENLPKLVEMVPYLTKSYDLAQSIMTDRVLINDLVGGMQECVKPLEGKIKEYAATAIEANDWAQANQGTTIGVFGLFRMLKDPQIQKVFRFAQAYLDLTSKKQEKQ
ncbi:DUF1641 domain-containing protein [Peribacillus frigoritolerans]|uniref:DUF1641 domain-containing protein n=1 Tax=Peribacillus frigoritolerans TaxID=450367 RepID=A0AAJ1QHX8_9BACI|nr:DUF1641 domain-containing protein [Peribacillus frigoritolerans]MDM5281778.1 DUF1641 domain-containing protein [Peribacillus frigoritolerans]